jgi:hypothetical protein
LGGHQSFGFLKRATDLTLPPVQGTSVEAFFFVLLIDGPVDGPQRTFEVSCQFKEKVPLIISFEISLLLENLVDPTKSPDITCLVQEMMETKILQGRYVLLLIRRLIKGEGSLPPPICAAAKARINGEKIEINELLPAPLDRQPVSIRQAGSPATMRGRGLLQPSRCIRLSAFAFQTGSGGRCIIVRKAMNDIR